MKRPMSVVANAVTAVRIKQPSPASTLAAWSSPLDRTMRPDVKARANTVPKTAPAEFTVPRTCRGLPKLSGISLRTRRNDARDLELRWCRGRSRRGGCAALERRRGGRKSRRRQLASTNRSEWKKGRESVGRAPLSDDTELHLVRQGAWRDPWLS